MLSLRSRLKVKPEPRASAVVPVPFLAPPSKKKKFAPRKNRWEKGSGDYSDVIIHVFDNYLHVLCEGKSDIRRVLLISCLNKHFNKHVMGSDISWFKLGNVWEDEYVAGVAKMSSVVVRNMWVVPGIFNRPSPDFEMYSISTPGVTNRFDSLSSTGQLRWNGYGKVESEEAKVIRGNLMKSMEKGSLEARQKLIDLGFAYDVQSYKAMVTYFRKCLYLTYSRDCIICGLGMDTVPVWVLNGRVCRGCLCANLMSNVALYARHNIDIRKVLPYVAGKVWFFRSLHQANYNARHFTTDPVDFQVEHSHTKWNVQVPDIFVWMPHLVQYLHIPHGCPCVSPRPLLVDGLGSAFDEGSGEFVKFSRSMLDDRALVVKGMHVIPKGGAVQRLEAGEKIAAFVQAFCVRFRFAAFGSDDRGLSYVDSQHGEILEAFRICYLVRTSVITTRIQAKGRLLRCLDSIGPVPARLKKVLEGIVLNGTMRVGAGVYWTNRSLLVAKVVSAVGDRRRSFFKLEYPGGYFCMSYKDKAWFDKHSNYLGDPKPLEDDNAFYDQYKVYKVRAPLPPAGGPAPSRV